MNGGRRISLAALLCFRGGIGISRKQGWDVMEKNGTAQLRPSAGTLAVLILFSTSLAFAQGVSIQSGQYLEGTIDPIGEAEQYFVDSQFNRRGW